MRRGVGIGCACIIAMLSGCSVPTRQEAFDSVAQQTRTHLVWIKTDQDAREVDRRVRGLLSEPLSEENAIRIALINNRTLQQAYEEIGIAQSELVEAGFDHLATLGIQGPGWMMPQFAEPKTYRFHWDNLAVGLGIFSIGLFKKVVLADGIAPYADAVFAPADAGWVPGAGEAFVQRLLGYPQGHIFYKPPSAEGALERRKPRRAGSARRDHVGDDGVGVAGLPVLPHEDREDGRRDRASMEDT